MCTSDCWDTAPRDLCATCKMCRFCHYTENHKFKRVKVPGLCPRVLRSIKDVPGAPCMKPVFSNGVCRDHWHKSPAYNLCSIPKRRNRPADIKARAKREEKSRIMRTPVVVTTKSKVEVEPPKPVVITTEPKVEPTV